jgi:hypothetical protein
MQLAGVPQSGKWRQKDNRSAGAPPPNKLASRTIKHGVRIEIDSFSAEAACCAFVHILTENSLVSTPSGDLAVPRWGRKDSSMAR